MTSRPPPPSTPSLTNKFFLNGCGWLNMAAMFGDDDWYTCFLTVPESLTVQTSSPWPHFRSHLVMMTSPLVISHRWMDHGMDMSWLPTKIWRIAIYQTLSFSAENVKGIFYPYSYRMPNITVDKILAVLSWLFCFTSESFFSFLLLFPFLLLLLLLLKSA